MEEEDILEDVALAEGYERGEQTRARLASAGC